MKTRGIENSIKRLGGARRMGSATLTALVESEARQVLQHAKEWLLRAETTPPREGAEHIRTIADAVSMLEKELAQTTVPAASWSDSWSYKLRVIDILILLGSPRNTVPLAAVLPVQPPPV
jgi:hypothetical protein